MKYHLEYVKPAKNNLVHLLFTYETVKWLFVLSCNVHPSACQRVLYYGNNRFQIHREHTSIENIFHFESRFLTTSDTRNRKEMPSASYVKVLVHECLPHTS